MALDAIPEGIYQDVIADSTLVALLGAVTASNYRVYRGYPQTAPVLSALEPAEGWMTISLLGGGIAVGNEQVESIKELLNVQMDIYATRYALAHQVVERLDQQFHWRLDQQRDLTYDTHLVLFSRRLPLEEDWEEGLRLFRVRAMYRMVVVRTTAEV